MWLIAVFGYKDKLKRDTLFIMPHFGLMDDDALGPVEGYLMRAKLHIRGGK
jgi:hypothetical protein